MPSPSSPSEPASPQEPSQPSVGASGSAKGGDAAQKESGEPSISSSGSPQDQSTVPVQTSPAGEQPSANTQSDFDIAEEYGTARKNLPPAGIVAICIAVVAVIVAVYALTHRAHPLSWGSIDDVVSVPLPAQNMVMVAINISVENNAQKPSWIHTITAALDTGGKTYTDDATPAVDVQRYFQALPDLKQHALDILIPETRLNPGQKVSGTVVVSFPVTADAFNARKSLTVTVAPYDEVPLVIKK